MGCSIETSHITKEMPLTIPDHVDTSKLRVGIVRTLWNESLVGPLVCTHLLIDLVRALSNFALIIRLLAVGKGLLQLESQRRTSSRLLFRARSNFPTRRSI